jgi:hypothetical protein
MMVHHHLVISMLLAAGHIQLSSNIVVISHYVALVRSLLHPLDTAAHRSYVAVVIGVDTNWYP